MAERGNCGAAKKLERAAAPLADRGFAVHARGLRPLLSQLDSSPIRSRLRGSLSLPFAINKARALGGQSRQLHRLICYKSFHLKDMNDDFAETED